MCCCCGVDSGCHNNEYQCKLWLSDGAAGMERQGRRRLDDMIAKSSIRIMI